MPSALERCFSYCETSAPETKALSPSPFSTITRTSGSCSKRSSAFGIASHMSIEIAFLRAGLLNVSQPIGPCFSATMRSLSSPDARAGCFRRARSSSWVMGLVLEAKTAIVSRATSARHGFSPSFGLCAGLPAAAHCSVGPGAEKIRMQKREDEIQREPSEHFPPPDFVEPELVAPLDDRCEREVGGGHGETLPVNADRSVLAPILQHRARHREQQKSAEENQ